MQEKVILETNFGDLKLYKKGKVRDVYDLGEQLLIVATDRISCFDVVLANGIPGKGRVLTALSCFWFKFLKDVVASHFISSDIKDFPRELKKYSDILSGRSMLVKKTMAFPIECVVRGYLSGSGWKEYKERQSVGGILLPAGLLESSQLPEILFTPSTKEDSGHDINITIDYVEKKLGKQLTQKLRNLSIAIYKKAKDYAFTKGIIIADTKFEFGIYDNELILIDEVLTPDSSRFWPKDSYSAGKPQLSFDKQFVRDYLETLSWDKNPPAPELTADIIEKTSSKYKEALKRLT